MSEQVKSAIEDRFKRGLSTIPPLAVTGAWRVFSLESITEIYNAGRIAGMVEAADSFLASLEKLQHRPFTIDWTDAITEVRTAAGKVGT